MPMNASKQLQDDIDAVCRNGLILSGDHLHALYLTAPSGYYFPDPWITFLWPKLRGFMHSARAEEA